MTKRKIYHIKYKGKNSAIGLVDTTILANSVKEIKDNLKKLNFKLISIN